MLGENSLVVVESIPKLVSEVVKLSKRAVTPLLFREPARLVGECAKDVKRIALNERARKVSRRMPHHGVVACIRKDLDGFNAHKI
jgi:hypothetical protein